MGKAKQRKVVAVDEGVPPQGATQASATKTHAADAPATPTSPWVGADALVTSDYLEMQGVPDDDGLAHSGYLVLVRGEQLRILYVGSAATDDDGWLYGEVTRTRCKEPVGRRGWLPAVKVDLAPAKPQSNGVSVQKEPACSRENQPRVQARGYAATAERHPGTGPGRPPDGNSLQRNGVSSVASKSSTAASQSRTAAPKAGKQIGSKPAQMSLRDEAFPSLVPGKQKRWDENSQPAYGGSGASAPGSKAEETPAPQPVDAAALIAKQRAAAAKAAASPKAAGATCPICMEKYSTAGRKQTHRPCCGVELCVQCDHKSLRSGRCYFCREEADDFPTLGLACRVASA